MRVVRVDGRVRGVGAGDYLPRFAGWIENGDASIGAGSKLYSVAKLYMNRFVIFEIHHHFSILPVMCCDHARVGENVAGEVG